MIKNHALYLLESLFTDILNVSEMYVDMVNIRCVSITFELVFFAFQDWIQHYVPRPAVALCRCK